MPFIDVPGVGMIEADNFATESTLQRMLVALEGGIGNADGSVDSLANEARQATTQISMLGRAQKQAKREVDAVSNSMRNAAGAASSFAGTANILSKGGARFNENMRIMGESPLSFTKTVLQLTTTMAGKFPMLTAAIGAGFGAMFSDDGPLMGSIKGAIGGAFVGLAPELAASIGGIMVGVLSETSENFTKIQKNGALLGGSLIEFRLAAHSAGLTLTQFNNVMQRAGSDMSMFAGQSLRGAREFSRLNQQVINDFGPRMLQMGVGFEEMGVRTAEMIAHLAESGVNLSELSVDTAQAAVQIEQLTKQQKLLAAINGTTIEQEKEKQRASRKDAQMNAIMLGLGAQERQGLQQLVGQFPQFSAFIKETIAFGGPVSKATLMQASQMGATTDALAETIAQIRSGAGEGAIDAFRRLQETSPLLQADLERQAEFVKLGLVANNEYLQIAENSFQTQFETFTKMNQQIVDSLADDMAKISEPMDKATEFITTLATQQQQLTRNMSSIATGLINTSSIVYNSIMGLQGLAVNATAAAAQALGVPSVFGGNLPGNTGVSTLSSTVDLNQAASDVIARISENANQVAEAGAGVPEIESGAGQVGTQVGPAGAANMVINTNDTGTQAAISENTRALRDLANAIGNIQ